MYFKPEMDNDNYLLKDLRRNYIRAASNQGWFEHEWLGVPIWQLGEDLVRLQNAIGRTQPKWIIETGTKYGGSAIFFASVLHALGLEDSRILSVDIEEHQIAKDVFSNHRLGRYVAEYFVGSATDPEIVQAMDAKISANPGPVLVFLDDNHNRDHVLEELNLYSPLVTTGSLIIVADTVFEDLAGSPVGKPTEKYPDMASSNPRAALRLFLENNDRFETDWGLIGSGGPSLYPDGFLKRIR